MKTLSSRSVWRPIAAGLGALAGALMLASLALAASHHPKGEFAPFAECPMNRQTISDCIYSLSSGGSVTIGGKTVPLSKPLSLQGGFEGSGEKIRFFGAENGETLSRTPQPVKGGLLGVTAPSWWPESLQEWFDAQSKGAAEVSATLELAAPATSIELDTEHLINGGGTALGLPIKIKLENPLLGSNCYVGSDSKPIQIDFTTGKSGAVGGFVGQANFNKEYTLITITGARLVNGTFAAPRASGCGGIFSPFFDPLVDSLLGTPSKSGENAAILKGKLEDAQAPAVKASE